MPAGTFGDVRSQRLVTDLTRSQRSARSRARHKPAEAHFVPAAGHFACRCGAQARYGREFNTRFAPRRQDRMSTYRLFKSPEGDIVRVKMGFSWQAFFIGSLSAIVRRTWLLAAVAGLDTPARPSTTAPRRRRPDLRRRSRRARVLRRLHALLRRQRQPLAERFAAPARIHADRRRAPLKARSFLLRANLRAFIRTFPAETSRFRSAFGEAAGARGRPTPARRPAAAM